MMEDSREGLLTKMRRKEYEEDLRRLQVELVQMQRWIVQEQAKVCIVFEGRDTAGKGGVIKRITERVSPRVFRVVALPAPTDRERSQMYFQRYVPHLPAGGEVVIFDRSWYNRGRVEPVMGFCTWKESARFLELVPIVEQAIIDSGVILIKYWLEVSQEEQTRRLTARIDDGRKTWKLSQMDLDSYGRWYDYSRGATTTCLPPRTRRQRRGTWPTRTTSVGPASTSSGTFSTWSRMCAKSRPR